MKTYQYLWRLIRYMGRVYAVSLLLWTLITPPRWCRG